MNHIMGFSSLMAEAHGEEKDEYAAIILNSSNQLLTLIENVILLSRLQSEKPEVNQQPLEPADIVTNLGDRLRPECLRKNIALKLKIPKDIPHLSILVRPRKNQANPYQSDIQCHQIYCRRIGGSGL